MADGVVIDKTSLEALDEALRRTLVEFDRAVKRSRELENAIGAPYGKTRLRDRAHTFESGWDIRRGDLQESLKALQERVEKVIAEFDRVDREIATAE